MEGSLEGQGGAVAVPGRASSAGVRRASGAGGRCRASRGLSGDRDLCCAWCREPDLRCREPDLRYRELLRCREGERRRRELDRRRRELDRRCREPDRERDLRRLERLRESRCPRCLDADLLRCRRLRDRDLERRREYDRPRDGERCRDCDRCRDAERRRGGDFRRDGERCRGDRLREMDRDRVRILVPRSPRSPGDEGRSIAGLPRDLNVRTGGAGG